MNIKMNGAKSERRKVSEELIRNLPPTVSVNNDED